MQIIVWERKTMKDTQKSRNDHHSDKAKDLALLIQAAFILILLALLGFVMFSSKADAATMDTYSETLSSDSQNQATDDHAMNMDDPEHTTTDEVDGTVGSGDSEIIAGHDNHVHELIKQDSTCTEEGSITFACSCGESYSQPINATGHVAVVDPAVIPTCTSTGLTEGSHCSVCNEIIVAQDTVAKLGHSEVTISGYAATCTENGLTDGVKCSVCDEILVAQKTIPVLEHTHGEIVVENRRYGLQDKSSPIKTVS